LADNENAREVLGDETLKTIARERARDLISNNIVLRPYQRSGIYWLNWLTNHHLHGVLADDMGLGKTIQMIAAMRLEYESTGSQSHSLVVCPKSVIGTWLREIKRVYPKINIYEYTGPRRDRYRCARATGALLPKMLTMKT